MQTEMGFLFVSPKFSTHLSKARMQGKDKTGRKESSQKRIAEAISRRQLLRLVPVHSYRNVLFVKKYCLFSAGPFLKSTSCGFRGGKAVAGLLHWNDTFSAPK
jgi:hypothetical protein